MTLEVRPLHSSEIFLLGALLPAATRQCRVHCITSGETGYIRAHHTLKEEMSMRNENERSEEEQEFGRRY